MEVNVEQVVAAYMKLREKKKAIEAKADEEVNAIKVKMEKFETWIREKANEDGVTSFKTRSGTAFLTTTDYANVADWDAVLNFIKTNQAFDMLERRISKTAVRSYIDAHKEVPAGVDYGTRLTVNVRKPTTKAE
jgi:prophage tail gpP-like protein